jgi:3-deoxy-D-manno-octulosonate 8-phosphate phosphatase (KDO 8-P phosphatase)
MVHYDYLISDVDGVLTCGGHYYSKEGKIIKRFGGNDADALKVLREKFVDNIIFITSDKIGFDISKRRIDDMGYQLIFVGRKEDRIKYLSSLDGDTIFIGDGIFDSEAYGSVKTSFCLKDSTPQAKRKATYILPTTAGNNVFSHLLEVFENNNKVKDSTEQVHLEETNEIELILNEVERIRKHSEAINRFSQNIAVKYNGKNKIVFCGVGKNALLADMLCEFLHPFNVVSISLDPHRALHGNLGLLHQSDILILSTKSGNTEELMVLMQSIKLKFDFKNTFLLTTNANSRLSQNFYFEDILVLPKINEIAKFSHSPQTTLLSFFLALEVVINRIVQRKHITETEYLLNHQAGEIGKSLLFHSNT